MLSRLCVGPLSAAVVITKYGAAHGSFAALMLLLLHQQSADDATDMGGSSQLRGMGVEDSNNFESHLFQCHLPIVKQRVTMITNMQQRSIGCQARNLGRPKAAATTT